MSWNGYENNVLLRNDGNHPDDGIPRFVDVGMALGADDVYDARGVAVADFDNDGDLDIVINHSQGDNPRDEAGGVPAVLYRNELGSSRPFFAVELSGRESPHQAAGAVVRLRAAGTVQTRLLDVGSAYASQQSDRLHFGLGDADRVDEVTVHWPSGLVESFADLPAARVLHVEEGTSSRLASLPRSPPAGGG